MVYGGNVVLFIPENTASSVWDVNVWNVGTEDWMWLDHFPKYRLVSDITSVEKVLQDGKYAIHHKAA